MALKLKKIFVTGSDQVDQTYIIESWHVSQSIDAFTGAVPYDITLTGSFTLTGSEYISGSISSSYGNNTVGFYGTSSWAISSSKAITSSYVSTGSTSNLSYGSFSSTTTQGIALNSSASFTYDTTEDSDGISIITGDKLQVTRTGIYNFQFSAQMLANTGANPDIYIWLRKNGSDVPRTNTRVTFVGGSTSFFIASWNFIVSLAASDYVQLWWYSTSDKPTLQAYNASLSPLVPAAPSLIATLIQIK